MKNKKIENTIFQSQFPQQTNPYDQFQQIQQSILEQYKKTYTIDPSINFIDIQFVPFETVPKFLKKNGELQIFDKFFAITQCPLYDMFTIIIFEHLYDTEVSKQQRKVNAQVLSFLKGLIYSQDFLKQNYYIKRLTVEGFRYMDQIFQQKIVEKVTCKKQSKQKKIKIKEKVQKGSYEDKQNHESDISSCYSSSEFSNSTFNSEVYAKKPITQILIEKDLIKGFVECWRQIVDRICINYQLELLRQQDELEIMELLSSFFELQFAFSLYKGKNSVQKSKQTLQEIIPCIQATTHISIVFNQEQSFQKSQNRDNSLSESSNGEKLNWKTFVFFSNKSSPPPSEKTSTFLATLNANKHKSMVKNAGLSSKTKKKIYFQSKSKAKKSIILIPHPKNQLQK